MAGETDKIKDDDLEMRRERGDFVEDDEETDEENKAADDTEGDDDQKADDGKKADDERKPPPYSRFKEVTVERDEERAARLRLEGENAALREQLKGAGKPPPEAPAPVDIRALRKAARDAMLEGDTEKAAELDAQADEEIERRAEARAVSRVEQTNAVRDLNAAATRMIEKYPFLDSQSEGADEEAIELVIAARDANIRKGMPPAEALEKAADKIGRLFSKDDDRGKGDGKDSDDAASTRTKQAITRNAAAANRQPPPPTGGRGERGRVTETGENINVAAMSDEEFKALPEKEKARLRGDIV